MVHIQKDFGITHQTPQNEQWLALKVSAEPQDLGLTAPELQRYETGVSLGGCGVQFIELAAKLKTKRRTSRGLNLWMHLQQTMT